MGCAGPPRLTRPADFPLHATDHPFFDLHWRLDGEARVVQAGGLVEAARVDGVAGVTVELIGLDEGGRVVSRGRTLGGDLLRWETRTFIVRVRPTGQEERFELRVWSFTWERTRQRGARNGRL